MFCKHCGKEIPNDSSFCQYCGEQLGESHLLSNIEKSGILNHFQTLSKGWQICIMLYICWVFFWIILCVSDVIDEYSRWSFILIFVIVIPMLVLFIWYYFSRLRKSNNEIDADELQTSHTDFSGNGYYVYPLTRFADLYGKMKVVVESGSQGIKNSYCIFTNPSGQIIQVRFGKTTSGLTAMDIADRKESLFIIQFPNKTFSLFEI